MSQIFFAQVAVESGQLLASWRLSSPGVREGVIIFGATGLVTLLVVLWAVYFRKRRRRWRAHHHSHPQSFEQVDSQRPHAGNRGSPPPGQGRKHRRRRRKHRARNPTLAETGGLPPIRPESPPEPPS